MRRDTGEHGCEEEVYSNNDTRIARVPDKRCDASQRSPRAFPLTDRRIGYPGLRYIGHLVKSNPSLAPDTVIPEIP